MESPDLGSHGEALLVLGRAFAPGAIRAHLCAWGRTGAVKFVWASAAAGALKR